MYKQYLLLFTSAEKKKKKIPAECVWEAQNALPKRKQINL